MIECVSENSILVTLGDQIDPTINARISWLCHWLEGQHLPWLIDLVPSYTTLLLVYDPMALDFRGVTRCVQGALAQLDGASAVSRPSAKRHDIPVYYSAETGPDLSELAHQKGLTERRIIELHCQREYQVYAIGFMPGFGFLGTTDPLLHTPRKDTPRPRVPAGSVAIANQQTAIYPKASPGGWQLIGRSPTPLFDRDSLSLLQIGDRVRFRPISRVEFLKLGGQL